MLLPWMPPLLFHASKLFESRVNSLMSCTSNGLQRSTEVICSGYLCVYVVQHDARGDGVLCCMQGNNMKPGKGNVKNALQMLLMES